MKFNHIIFTIFISLVVLSCKKDELSPNVITVDTDYVLNDNYFGGAMQWEPNDRDAMSDKQWNLPFRTCGIYEVRIYTLLHHALLLLFRI